jgi:hypothetical protein
MSSKGATDQDYSVQLRLAIVTSVDPETYTVNAQFVSSEEPTSDVILGGAYVSLRGPGWIGALPEAGDMALLAKPRYSPSWIAISYVPYPQRKTTEGTEEGSEILPPVCAS